MSELLNQLIKVTSVSISCSHCMEGVQSSRAVCVFVKINPLVGQVSSCVSCVCLKWSRGRW